MFRLNMCLDGERNNLPINATFTVLKVVDINEDESFIDIFFKLHLAWFDKSLTFKFLKYSDNENTLGKVSIRFLVRRLESRF